jgi:hypothetical protein
MPNTPLLTSVLALCSVAVAQRGESTLKHGAFAAMLEYGQPAWAKRSLDDLPVGKGWRLGMNNASSWKTQAPLLQGNVLLAPGAYRIDLQRTAESDFRIDFASSGLGVNGTGVAGFACKLGAADVQKKLLIELVKGDAKAKVAPDADLPARVAIRFGPHRVEGDFVMIGGRELASTPKWKLIGWSLPAQVVEDALAAGQSVAVATFLPTKKLGNKDPELCNVVVSSKGAEVLPGLLLPEATFGFGEVVPPLASWKQPGEVTWSDLAQPTARLEFGAKAERKDKRYVLELRCGKKAAMLKVSEPEGKS